MSRHPARRALMAAALVCAGLGLVSCASTPDPDAQSAGSADTPACRMFKPVSVDLGLGEPSVSQMAGDGCTAHTHEFGTLTLTLRDRPYEAVATGDGKRSTMKFGEYDAVMLMGSLNGVCKIFLDTGEKDSVELRLGRTTAMTPQVCTSLKKAAGKLAASLPAPTAAAG
ncbi:hypothetical protein OG875_29555 [Streptomyces sp. NBC_01498]|uniref:hypothetical protein n=1 Tax=Streptomyces sp. NBC_01498 TaxID=2975870 RepID=UPI002E7BE325|nr:hypothetical protein [Streptomyces sp. NBC_01498]WTL28367.1 hypothetical protein OG875_29555 [Streptomyces sp. NBC_01498]